MPIYLPSNIIISNVKINHDIPTLTNQSINRKVTSRDRGIHQISGSLDITVTSEASKRALEAFLMKTQGKANPFILDLGNRFTAADANLTSVYSLGVNNIGSTTLTVSSVGGAISAGDLFKIPNDSKCYMALSDLTPNTDGSIDCYPPIRQQIPAFGNIYFTDVTLYVRLKNDIQSIEYTESGMIHVMSLEWEEAL